MKRFLSDPARRCLLRAAYTAICDLALLAAILFIVWLAWKDSKA